MRKIDEATKALIQERIADVERTCESELVCLIAKRSARYVLYPLLITAILSLMFPVSQAFADLFGFHGFALRFQHQTIFFVVCAILFTCTPIRHMVTPKWLQHQNCARYGTELFFRHHLHETDSRNAILIFVSWEEKYVTIIADKGINARVQQSDWDDLILGFVNAIKADDMANGFLSIISGAGDLLIKYFPKESPKREELPNHLIEIDGAPYVS